MRFKVPRHIEYESKIVGGLSFKQMLYLGGGAVVIFLLYFIIPFLAVFLIISVIVVATSISLAFVNVGTQSFPEYVKSLFLFSLSSKTYLWKKKDIPPVIKDFKRRASVPEEKEEREEVKAKGKSKLHDVLTRIETS